MPASRDRRRELRDAYERRATEAGVFLLRNTATGRILIASTINLQSQRNKLDFGQTTNSTGVLDRRMAADAQQHGMAAIELEVLDVLDVQPGMTAAEVAADLAALTSLWREKLADVPQY